METGVKARMRLLICTQKVDKNDPILGFFHRWLGEFSKHWEHIHVIALGVGEYDLPENVSVYSLGKPAHGGQQLKAKNYKLKAFFRFYKYIFQQRKNYGAVFVHMNPEYVLLGGPLWRLLGKRVALWYTHKSVDAKLRLAEKFLHLIFSASKESFRLESPKLHVLGHGIDTEQFAPRENTDKPRTPLRILSASRISETKGLAELLRACAQLSIPYQVRLVGVPVTDADVAYERTLRLLAEELGITEHVTFAGSIPHTEIPAELAAADVFVNLSRTGSIDKAVLEAMSAGVLPVTSNEAFSSVSPDLCMIDAADPEQIAHAVTGIASLSGREYSTKAEMLREYVVKEHSIQTCIDSATSRLKHA